jgi:hypothetical protein
MQSIGSQNTRSSEATTKNKRRTGEVREARQRPVLHLSDPDRHGGGGLVGLDVLDQQAPQPVLRKNQVLVRAGVGTRDLHILLSRELRSAHEINGEEQGRGASWKQTVERFGRSPAWTPNANQRQDDK